MVFFPAAVYVCPVWRCSVSVRYSDIPGVIFEFFCRLQRVLWSCKFEKNTFLSLFAQLNEIFIRSQRESEELNGRLDNYVTFVRRCG